jgi:hypothetical protein
MKKDVIKQSIYIDRWFLILILRENKRILKDIILTLQFPYEIEILIYM